MRCVGDLLSGIFKVIVIIVRRADILLIMKFWALCIVLHTLMMVYMSGVGMLSSDSREPHIGELIFPWCKAGARFLWSLYSGQSASINRANLDDSPMHFVGSTVSVLSQPGFVDQCSVAGPIGAGLMLIRHIIHNHR